MSNKLTINNGSVELEAAYGMVTLPLGDQRFLPGYYGMYDRISKKVPEMQEVAKDFGDDVYAHFALNTEIHEYIKGEVDTLLGEGTCYKVFGDIVPGMELYEQFFAQISPYVEDYNTRRYDEITSKYTPSSLSSDD